jgi:hypothetical protein
MSETPKPTSEPITDHDIERELTAMTEPAAQTEPELWRAALEQSRGSVPRRTRRIPGRRRNRSVRLVIPMTAVLVVCAALAAVLAPSLSQSRQTARAVTERPPAALALPAMPQPATESADAQAFAAFVEPRLSSDRGRAADAPGTAAPPAMGRSSTSIGAGARGRSDRESAAQEPMQAARLIATRAEISLIVEDVEQTVRSCRVMLDPSRQEYLERSTVAGQPGDRRGQITLRIATDRQDAVLDAVRDLGDVDHESVSAEDLTGIITDTEARLSTLRQVERELTDLLERRENDSLSDIVTAQTELGKTRGQIESLEARLRSQQQRVRLSTIIIDAREQADPGSQPLPSYGQTFVNAGRDALTVLDRVLYGAVVSAPVWVLVTLTWLAWLVWRRLSRR